MTESSSDLLFISDEEAGCRLDKILAVRFSGRYSRTYFQHLIEENLVLLNGEPVKKRIKPSPKDEVEVQFALTPEMGIFPEAIPLDILYEDEAILIVNKPVGMVVHPAPGNWSGTFAHALLHHCQTLRAENTLRPGIVHRLDKDTSGLLVAAKTIGAQQKLIEMFAARQIYKEYLAICVGNPGSVTIDVPIGRDPHLRKQMAVVESGRHALTHAYTLATAHNLSLVKVAIATGRTHQIRVHMRHIGTPILGDPLYGNMRINKQYAVDHQLLHASKLRFSHPVTGESLELAAPLNDSMQRILKSKFCLDNISSFR